MKSKEAGIIFTEGEIFDVVVYPLEKNADDRGWLAELFRHDSIAEEFHPVMAYVSLTEPGITRGPHEHEHQADLFCFFGPSTFRLRLWDYREGSPTYGNMMTLEVGENNMQGVIIPKNVVHAYLNIGHQQGLVINCANRLYKGVGKMDKKADEIRHEKDPDTIFRMD